MKYKIECPYFISPLKEHLEIKEQLLSEINKTDKKKAINLKVNTVIGCDYDWSFDNERPYLKTLLPFLTKHLSKEIKNQNFDQVHIHNVWFQQYIFNDIHDWHIHGQTQFTCVYYLELPEQAPVTEFIHPFNQDKKQDFNIKEGDILIFPSFVLHRGKRNKSQKRKTIISFNLDMVNGDNDFPENYLDN